MRKRNKGKGNTVTRIAGGAVAGVLAEVVNNMLLSDTEPLYKGAGMAVVGAALPEFVNFEGANEVGTGLVAVGVSILANKYITQSTEKKVEGINYRRFNNAISDNMSRYWSDTINPAGGFNNAVSGRGRKKKIGVVQ